MTLVLEAWYSQGHVSVFCVSEMVEGLCCGCQIEAIFVVRWAANDGGARTAMPIVSLFSWTTPLIVSVSGSSHRSIDTSTRQSILSVSQVEIHREWGFGQETFRRTNDSRNSQHIR